MCGVEVGWGCSYLLHYLFIFKLFNMENFWHLSRGKVMQWPKRHQSHPPASTDSDELVSASLQPAPHSRPPSAGLFGHKFDYHITLFYFLSYNFNCTCSQFYSGNGYSILYDWYNLCYFETLKTKACWKTMTKIGFDDHFSPI